MPSRRFSEVPIFATLKLRAFSVPIFQGFPNFLVDGVIVLDVDEDTNGASFVRRPPGVTATKKKYSSFLLRVTRGGDR